MQYKERDIVEFRPTISAAFTRPKKMIVWNSSDQGEKKMKIKDVYAIFVSIDGIKIFCELGNMGYIALDHCADVHQPNQKYLNFLERQQLGSGLSPERLIEYDLTKQSSCALCPAKIECEGDTILKNSGGWNGFGYGPCRNCFLKWATTELTENDTIIHEVIKNED